MRSFSIRVADAWVHDPRTGDRTTLRRLLRGALSVLTTHPLDDEERLAALLRQRAPMPHRFVHLDEVHAPGIAAALEISPDECWIVRPDEHIGASLDRADTAGIVTAAERILGRL